jgi:hypothetical protein
MEFMIYVDTLVHTVKGDLCRLGTDDYREVKRLANMATNAGFRSIDPSLGVYFLTANQRRGALELGATAISSMEFEARCLGRILEAKEG